VNDFCSHLRGAHCGELARPNFWQVLIGFIGARIRLTRFRRRTRLTRFRRHGEIRVIALRLHASGKRATKHANGLCGCRGSERAASKKTRVRTESEKAQR